MRVFLGPRWDPDAGGPIVGVARRLAGPEGDVVALRDLGVRTLARPLTAAELSALRSGLEGQGPVIGYLCSGVSFGWGPAGSDVASAVPPVQLAVVTDHADLAWRSPLSGPNDDKLGPRFPSLLGAYAPEVALGRLEGTEGMIVQSRVVAGVHDDRHLLPFEARLMKQMGWEVASCELVAPVIIAAHLGLKVAAVIVARPALRG